MTAVWTGTVWRPSLFIPHHDIEEAVKGTAEVQKVGRLPGLWYPSPVRS